PDGTIKKVLKSKDHSRIMMAKFEKPYSGGSWDKGDMALVEYAPLDYTAKGDLEADSNSPYALKHGEPFRVYDNMGVAVWRYSNSYDWAGDTKVTIKTDLELHSGI